MRRVSRQPGSIGMKERKGLHAFQQADHCNLSDSLETLARRHYENKILMLAFFDVFLHTPRFDFTDLPAQPPARSMPLSIERQMCVSFHEDTARYGEQA